MLVHWTSRVNQVHFLNALQPFLFRHCYSTKLPIRWHWASQELVFHHVYFQSWHVSFQLLPVAEKLHLRLKFLQLHLGETGSLDLKATTSCTSRWHRFGKKKQKKPKTTTAKLIKWHRQNGFQQMNRWNESTYCGTLRLIYNSYKFRQEWTQSH